MSDAQQELHEATDLLRAYQADTTRLEDLDASILRLTVLISRLPDDEHVLPAALTNLSAALRNRSPEDLDNAVAYARRAVELTDPHDSWSAPVSTSSVSGGTP